MIHRPTSLLPAKNVTVWTDMLSHTPTDGMLMHVMYCTHCGVLHIISHRCSFFPPETWPNIKLTFSNPSFSPHLTLLLPSTFLLFLSWCSSLFYMFYVSSTCPLDFHTLTLFIAVAVSLCMSLWSLSLLFLTLYHTLLLLSFLSLSLSQGGMYGERQASLPLMDSYDG